MFLGFFVFWLAKIAKNGHLANLLLMLLVPFLNLDHVINAEVFSSNDTFQAAVVEKTFTQAVEGIYFIILSLMVS